MNTVEKMIFTARCAARLREAAQNDPDIRSNEDRLVLLRAADRYSGRIDELCRELLEERR